jgi:predicted enzyme related to lactoylglutathione lyase
MDKEIPRGRFVWHDLMTTDTESATKFYTHVLGWDTETWNMGPTPYTMWKASTGNIGGVMPLPDEAKSAGAPPHWMTYVSTPNVDDTAAKVQELGGQVLVPPTDIPTVGKFAVFTDPTGATFAGFTPNAEAPLADDAPPKTGEMSWHELATTDRQVAFDFYSKLFGWETTSEMDMGPDLGVYQMYGRQGVPLGGIYNIPSGQPMPPSWLSYTRVDDLNATVDRVKSAGGQVVTGPMEVPGGDTIAVCIDPQGAAFAVHQSKSA